jgi:hypothetical protein
MNLRKDISVALLWMLLNVLIKSQEIRVQGQDVPMSRTSLDENSKAALIFKNALDLFNQTTQAHLQRIGDINILSFLHVTLVFIRYMSNIPGAMDILKVDFPWSSLANMLNSVLSLQMISTFSLRDSRIYSGYCEAVGPSTPPPGRSSVTTHGLHPSVVLCNHYDTMACKIMKTKHAYIVTLGDSSSLVRTSCLNGDECNI